MNVWLRGTNLTYTFSLRSFLAPTPSLSSFPKRHSRRTEKTEWHFSSRSRAAYGKKPDERAVVMPINCGNYGTRRSYNRCQTPFPNITRQTPNNTATPAT
jgi:hypothetical protein